MEISANFAFLTQLETESAKGRDELEALL